MIKELTDLKLLTDFEVAAYDNPFINYVVYEENNIIIGYLSYNLIYDRIEIVNIFVKENYRNQKTGSKLLSYLIDFASKRQILNITLEVNITNKYAIKLYEKYGFKRVTIRKGYYNGIDGILMELIL